MYENNLNNFGKHETCLGFGYNILYLIINNGSIMVAIGITTDVYFHDVLCSLYI